jgi:hypothetical protein
VDRGREFSWGEAWGHTVFGNARIMTSRLRNGDSLLFDLTVWTQIVSILARVFGSGIKKGICDQ